MIFPGDDGPISLIGRIDRIDVNERTGEVAVLDYKSSDSAKSPDQVPSSRSGCSTRRWIDFQLPLYRYLVRSLGLPEPVQLGYVRCCTERHRDKTGFAENGPEWWTVEELDGRWMPRPGRERWCAAFVRQEQLLATDRSAAGLVFRIRGHLSRRSIRRRRAASGIDGEEESSPMTLESKTCTCENASRKPHFA